MNREPDCPCSQPAQPRPRCRTLDALDASASAAPPAERGWSKDSFCPGVGSGLGVCKLKSLEQYVLYRYLLLRLLNVHFSGFLNVRLVYLFEVFICISFVFWMSSWLYSFIFLPLLMDHILTNGGVDDHTWIQCLKIEGFVFVPSVDNLVLALFCPFKEVIGYLMLWRG